MTSSANSKNWWVYIVECRDGRLYTGITNDLENRMIAHNEGTGARFTRGRGPVTLKYFESLDNRSTASKRELQIKSLSREAKLKLIEHFNCVNSKLSLRRAKP